MGRAHGVNKNNKNSDKTWINKPSRGIGDTVEKIIHAATGGRVKSCTGCQKRRDALNNALPYKPCRKCKKEDPPPTT